MLVDRISGIIFGAALLGTFGAGAAHGSDSDAQLADYFTAQTATLRNECLSGIETLEQWEQKRPEYKRQLLEMLGLDPLPERTPLHPVVTGTTQHEQFTVERLHFQSSPGLYVTANLYVPKDLDKPAPAILYVCGHGPVMKDGVSYGNKARYQHHGDWFARHGYVCLIIDSLQLGEIEAIHHGTYRYNMWWWNSRGYCPAGVEAWNCIRSLDYLQTRPEVDAGRLGVTGRSGGGAYSWWIAAIDERIKAAVPVAGITDLQNHVVDGCVEGHCDCMYILNTYRWDYPMVAALVAPRPLLISNSDKDGIFPLDGVFRCHQAVRHIYRLHDADPNLGLHITEGPHKDTQELRIHAFVWFNRFLKGENPLISQPAVALFEPEQLRVFDDLPVDEHNTTIHETFVPKASPPGPRSAVEWANQRSGWTQAIREKCFAGWPQAGDVTRLDLRRQFSVERQGIRLTAFDFTSQEDVRLRLYLARWAALDRPDGVVLHILDEDGWRRWVSGASVVFALELGEFAAEPNETALRHVRQSLENSGVIHAYFCPRGLGVDRWGGDERKQTQIRRRFMLLGQTLDGMRVWDVRRALEALRMLDLTKGVPVAVEANGALAGVALYASLFDEPVSSLELTNLPESHREGPIFLNVMKYLDMPYAVAMAVERCGVVLQNADPSAWAYARDVVGTLGLPADRLRIISGDGAR